MAEIVKVQPQEQHAVVNVSEVIDNGGRNQQVINNGSEKENESVRKSPGVIDNGSEKEKENESVPKPPGVINNESVWPKSLYVGDLEPNVSDPEIQELFQRVGPVVSVRICRDAITKTSLGYGYVNYSTAEHASEALRSLNFTPINGKPIRIMYSQRDPTIRKCGTANIFIKNLHKAVDNKNLYEKFSVFGPILSSKIATDASGHSKGYGFVHFEQDEAAQNAIKCMNGSLINDMPVYVCPFMKKEEREKTKLMKNEERERTKFMKKEEPEPEQTNGETKFKNVFVNNLSESMNDEELRKYFSNYGTIISVAVMRDVAGRSKCFGFVNFENVDDAVKSVESLNGKKIDGREWYVGKALKKSELREQSGTNLYLKHLDDSIDDNKLRELFSIYGSITSCKVMRDCHGYSKGSGFVSFSSPHEASRALVEMDKKVVLGKPLYVALAQRKEERRAMLQSHFSQLPNPVEQKVERTGEIQSHLSQLPNQIEKKEERRKNLQPHLSQLRNVVGMEPTHSVNVPMDNTRGPTPYHPIGMVSTLRGPTSFHPIDIVPSPRGRGRTPASPSPTLYHPIGTVPSTFPSFPRYNCGGYGQKQHMFNGHGPGQHAS